MSKRKLKERYVIELPLKHRSEEDIQLFTDTMNKLLLCEENEKWFINNNGNYLAYVIRDYQLGRRMSQEIYHLDKTQPHISALLGYYGWHQAPSRTMVGELDDGGLTAFIRPGDDFKAASEYVGIGVTKAPGLFKHYGFVKSSKELGTIIRFWFQGDSTSVYKARRTFHHHWMNLNHASYHDLDLCLAEAQKRLSPTASIFLLNDEGALYEVNLLGIRLAPNCGRHNYGAAMVFEYRMIHLEVNESPIGHVEKPMFERQLKKARAQFDIWKTGL